MPSTRSKKKRNFAPLEIPNTNPRKSRKLRFLTGLTLQELIVIIIIIGILIALALPQFGITRERALVKEATTNLRLIAAAEKIYRLEIGVYYPGDGTTQSASNAINSWLKLDLTETNWDYEITGGAGTFTATADRIAGNYSSCIYRIDEVTDEPCTCVSGSCPPGARVCSVCP